MKKEILLPGAALLGGLAGFGLRRWELAACYDPVTKRMADGCPAPWLLAVLAAALLVLFAAGCRGMGKDRRSPEEWFYAPDTGYILLMTCAGLVLLMGGALGLWEQMTAYRKDVIQLLLAVLCLAAGPATLMAGRGAYRGVWSERMPLLLMAPSFCTLVWLVAAYQQHSRQPVVRLFAGQMLAAVAVVLALYALVTLSLDKGGAGWACVLGLMGVTLTLTALADGQSLLFNLIGLFAVACLTAQCHMLLRPRARRMPQGADEEEERGTERE